MSLKRFMAGFVTVFAITLVISAIVTLLWDWIFHKTAVIDWGTSFYLALIFGIIFPWLAHWGSQKKAK